MYLSGIVILIFAAIVIFCFSFSNKATANEHGWITLLAAIAIIGACFLIQSGRDNKKEEQLAQEVPMTQVTVQGKKYFEAKVLIVYKDGKLRATELIPKSTVEIPVSAKK